ncbi:ribonuclease H-like domain-containing protein [Tanacetum coccineum]
MSVFMAIEETNHIKKGETSGCNSELNLHVNDPLFLHANDSNRTPLITFKLTGTDNYKIWAAAVHLALHTKNKLRFINGKCARDESNDEFKEIYDKIDGSVIYNFHFKIYSLTKSGSPLFEYYHSYNSLWRQFDSLVDLPSCSCDSASKLKDHKDLMRLMQFLIGLDDTYSVVRSQILTAEPLPDAKSDFATLSRVESHKNNLVHTSFARPSSSAFVSNNRPNTWSNNRNNQSRGPGFKKKNYGGSNVSNNASSSSIKSDQSAGSPSPFTAGEINRLMALVSSKFDTGATQHMTFSTEHLLGHPSDQVLSILEDKIKINSMSDIQPCDMCYKAKQTREPFPLNDHKTKCLAVNKFDEPYDDKRDSRKGDNDGIIKSPDCANVSIDTSPTSTNHSEEVVTQSPNRHCNNNSDCLGSSGASPKESSVLKRSSRQHRMPAKFENYVLEKKVKYENINSVVKNKSNEEVERFKARLVAKGFSKKEDVDYEETFSPVVKIVIVMYLLTVAVSNKWSIYQLDINSAFLYGESVKDVYMQLHDGYFSDNDNKVFKLTKSLYGLKQALRKWNEKLTQFLNENGFIQSKSDESLYTKSNDDIFIVLLIYVDDIIITGNNENEINNFKEHISSKFKIIDLGKHKYFLGLEILEISDSLCLNQRKYCLELLYEYDMLACKPAKAPIPDQSKKKKDKTKSDVDYALSNITCYQKIVGKLIYLAITRPDCLC